MGQLAKPVEGVQMRSYKRREISKREETTGLAPSGKICWLQLWQGKAAPLKLQESQPHLRRHQTKKSTELTGPCCGTTTGKEGNAGKDFPRNPPDLDLGPNICRAFLTISFHAKPTGPNKSAEQISIKNGTGMHKELWILSSALHPLKHHGVTQLQTEIFLGSPSDNQQTMNPKGMEKTLFKDIKMVLSKNRTKVTRQVVGNPVETPKCSTYFWLQMI